MNSPDFHCKNSGNDLGSFAGWKKWSEKTLEKRVFEEDVQKKVTQKFEKAKNKNSENYMPIKWSSSKTVTLWAQFANLKGIVNIVNIVAKMLNEVRFSISNRLWLELWPEQWSGLLVPTDRRCAMQRPRWGWTKQKPNLKKTIGRNKLPMIIKWPFASHSKWDAGKSRELCVATG